MAGEAARARVVLTLGALDHADSACQDILSIATEAVVDQVAVAATACRMACTANTCTVDVEPWKALLTYHLGTVSQDAVAV